MLWTGSSGRPVPNFMHPDHHYRSYAPGGIVYNSYISLFSYSQRQTWSHHVCKLVKDHPCFDYVYTIAYQMSFSTGTLIFHAALHFVYNPANILNINRLVFHVIYHNNDNCLLNDYGLHIYFVIKMKSDAVDLEGKK